MLVIPRDTIMEKQIERYSLFHWYAKVGNRHKEALPVMHTSIDAQELQIIAQPR